MLGQGGEGMGWFPQKQDPKILPSLLKCSLTSCSTRRPKQVLAQPGSSRSEEKQPLLGQLWVLCPSTTWNKLL